MTQTSIQNWLLKNLADMMEEVTGELDEIQDMPEESRFALHEALAKDIAALDVMMRQVLSRCCGRVTSEMYRKYISDSREDLKITLKDLSQRGVLTKG